MRSRVLAVHIREGLDDISYAWNLDHVNFGRTRLFDKI